MCVTGCSNNCAIKLSALASKQCWGLGAGSRRIRSNSILSSSPNRSQSSWPPPGEHRLQRGTPAIYVSEAPQSSRGLGDRDPFCPQTSPEPSGKQRSLPSFSLQVILSSFFSLLPFPFLLPVPFSCLSSSSNLLPASY